MMVSEIADCSWCPMKDAEGICTQPEICDLDHCNRIIAEHWLEKAENAEKGRKMMNQENQENQKIDKNGHRILPAGFDVKKAERIMGNFLNYHSLRHTTFSEVASSLILSGTGYDGGTSSNYLCNLLGVDGGDMATLKNWKARVKP